MAQGKMTFSDDELLQRMEESPDPAFTAIEIAEWFDVGVETARRRVEMLVDEGKVRRKKPSTRNVMYWPESKHGQLVFSA